MSRYRYTKPEQRLAVHPGEVFVSTLHEISREEALEAASAKVLCDLKAQSDDPLGDVFTIRLSLAASLSGFSKHILRKNLPIIDGGRKNHRVTYSSLRQFLKDKTTPTQSTE